MIDQPVSESEPVAVLPSLPSSTTERLLAVADELEAHPERWDQGVWARGLSDDPSLVAGRGLCDTPGCFCGHGVMMTPPELLADVHSWHAAGAIAFGFDEDLAAVVFAASWAPASIAAQVRLLASLPEGERSLERWLALPGVDLVGAPNVTLTGGDASTLTGGNASTLTGGYRSTLTGGYRSTLTGGDASTLTGGDRSTLTGGDGSTLTGGNGSTLTGGDRSTLIFRWWDLEAGRYRVQVAEIGLDGIEPGVAYHRNGAGLIVPVEVAA